MGKQKQEQLSEQIFVFLHLVTQLQEQAKQWEDEELEMDRLQQDYLHQLELENTRYHDRAHIANMLRHCRIRRRDIKNKLEISEALINFVTSDRGKVLIAHLQEVAGKTRKVETIVRNRAYAPRVLDQEEYYRFRNDKNDT